MTKQLSLVIAALLVLSSQALGQGENAPKAEVALARPAAIRKALEVRIEIPEQWRKSVSLDDVLKKIAKSLADSNLNCDIVVHQSVAAEFQDAENGVLSSVVRIATPQKSMTLQQVLDYILGFGSRQIGGEVSVGYVIKTGRIELSILLGIEKMLDNDVAIQLRDVPLQKAIEELADRSGISVMIDPRCRPILNAPVSVDANCGTSVRGILKSWSEFLDLKLIIDSHRITILPRSDYIKTIRAIADEEEVLSTIRKRRADFISWDPDNRERSFQRPDPMR